MIHSTYYTKEWCIYFSQSNFFFLDQLRNYGKSKILKPQQSARAKTSAIRTGLGMNGIRNSCSTNGIRFKIYNNAINAPSSSMMLNILNFFNRRLNRAKFRFTCLCRHFTTLIKGNWVLVLKSGRVSYNDQRGLNCGISKQTLSAKNFDSQIAIGLG